MSFCEKVLVETIDEVVGNVFGEKTAKIILQYLKEKGSETVLQRVESFSDALPRILGRGSAVVEDLILDTLCLKCGLKLERKEGCGFIDYVKELGTKSSGTNAIGLTLSESKWQGR